uniref:Protein FAM161A n=1 Tax=Neogobius melanostomus TaxID=47308 RepID=A0A8C6UHX5_9GOBI
MATVHRSTSLENKQLMSLYRGENKHSSQGCEERCADSGDEGKGRGSIRSSVSLEIYGLQREQREQQVYFSNQEYYKRLEELKSAHLRNIAELECMYISQAVEQYNREGEGVKSNTQNRRLFSDGPVRRLQRINSQEELDFHDTSSGSDQSELCAEERREEEMDKHQMITEKDATFGRLMLSREEPKKQRPLRFQSKNLKTKMLSLSGVKAKAKSKVTIPKPFQMMMREEERKRHKVRTRSEVELENSMLKRELEELRECKKQFRASPAPTHIHLPLYEVVSQRFSQRPAILGKCNPTKQPFESTKQFEFLERERRKREARIVAELGNLCPRDETRQFKARPMPRSVYGPKYNAVPPPQFVSMEREVTEGHSDPNSDLETETVKAENTAPDGEKSSKCPLSKPVKKQIEVSIEMVKEKPWSYIDPLRTTACNMCSPLQPTIEKSDYISV